MANGTDDFDGFLNYKGDGCFRIKKKISKKMDLLHDEHFVIKFNEHGDFVAVRASRYWNGHRDTSSLWDRLRQLDGFIMGRIRKDDEILQKILFGKD